MGLRVGGVCGRGRVVVSVCTCVPMGYVGVGVCGRVRVCVRVGKGMCVCVRVCYVYACERGCVLRARVCMCVCRM